MGINGMIENYFSFFCTILCKNPTPLLHAPCILVRKKLEKRLCLTGTRGHPVILTKKHMKKCTKKAETLKFFEHFDLNLIGVTGFEPAASWSRTKHSTELSHTPMCQYSIPHRGGFVKGFFGFLEIIAYP